MKPELHCAAIGVEFEQCNKGTVTMTHSCYATDKSHSAHAQASKTAVLVESTDLSEWPFERLWIALMHLTTAKGLPYPSAISGVAPVYPSYEAAIGKIREELVRCHVRKS